MSSINSSGVPRLACQRGEATIARRGGEEGGYLVAEGSVICMFHDCHELNDVVSQMLYPWEDILGELWVCTYSILCRGDTDYDKRREGDEIPWASYTLTDKGRGGDRFLKTYFSGGFQKT